MQEFNEDLEKLPNEFFPEEELANQAGCGEQDVAAPNGAERGDLANADAPPSPFAPIAAGEGCPPPIVWQQVLESFENDSTCWELNRDGYVIHGRVWGSGPPLYLLNGLLGTQRFYALLVWLLRDNFRCIVWDYPNAGLQSRALPNLNLDDYANDLLAIADLHGDDQIPLYCTSFGCLVALTAALESPQRINSILIQGGAAHLRLSVFERTALAALSRFPGDLRRIPLMRRVQTWNHRLWFPGADHSRWQFFLDEAGNVAASAWACRARLLHGVDLRHRLNQISQPVKLLTAEGDGILQKARNRDLEHDLANVELEALHSCGQFPYLTHPHRLAKLVREFVLPPANSENTRDAVPSP